MAITVSLDANNVAHVDMSDLQTIAATLGIDWKQLATDVMALIQAVLVLLADIGVGNFAKIVADILPLWGALQAVLKDFGLNFSPPPVVVP